MGVCVHVSHQYFRSVYIFLLSLKVGWGLGDWDVGCGTWGLRDVRMWDSRTWDIGTGGRDKQTSPDFSAEFVKYNFWQSSER